MSKTKNVSQQQLTWEQPRPIRQQVRKYPVQDGVSVPNSVTEDIGGFSIAPLYSSKQLRRINRLQTRKRSYRMKSDLIRKTCRDKPKTNRILEFSIRNE